MEHTLFEDVEVWKRSARLQVYIVQALVFSLIPLLAPSLPS